MVLCVAVSGCRDDGDGAPGGSTGSDATTSSDDAVGTTNTTGADTTSDSSAGETTIDTTDGDSSTSGDASSSTTTGASDCAIAELGELEVVVSNFYWFEAPDLFGDPTLADVVTFGFATADVGMFDLSEPPNNDSLLCHQCIAVGEDDHSRRYFQSSGTIQILDDPLDGEVAMVLTDVRLVEATIDDSGLLTPVRDGACVRLADGMVASPPGPEVPREWTCPSEYFGAYDGCDCGCGAIDPDCDPPEIDSCSYCDNPGSCSEEACPGTIDPADIATCS